MPIGSDQNELVKRIFDAVRNCDLDSFYQVLGEEKDLSSVTKSQLKALFNHVATDHDGNSILHDLLVKDGYFQIGKKRRRQVRVLMLERLLQEDDIKEALNRANFQGDALLHLAVKNGYHFQVETLIEAGAKINQRGSADKTPLELAAEYNRRYSYKILLDANKAANKNLELDKSYSCLQLDAASTAMKKELQQKHKKMKVLGTIMSIACPVGAVLAFTEWPLLDFFFGILFASAGPAIGLGAAIVFGGLLYWTFQSKLAKKFGEPAQKIVDLDVTVQKIERLEAELKHNKKILDKDPSGSWLLIQRQQQLREDLDQLYNTLPKVRREAKADWATTRDEVQTFLTAAAGFLCAFSGVLGIVGGLASFLSPYLPTITLMSAVCLGVPFGAWCALGLALTVAAVGAYVFHEKQESALEERELSHYKLHARSVDLLKKRAVAKEDKGNVKIQPVVDVPISPETETAGRTSSDRAAVFNPELTFARNAGKNGFLKLPPPVTSERSSSYGSSHGVRV